MSGAIGEGGGSQPHFDPSLVDPQADAEHIAEAGAEIIGEQSGIDPARLAKKYTDSVETANRGEKKEDVQVLFTRPDQPGLPPGTSEKAIKDLLKGGFDDDSVKEVAAKLTGTLPNELQKVLSGDVAAANPEEAAKVAGLGDAIQGISKASAQAENFIAGVGAADWLGNLGEIKGMPAGPGAIDPASAPFTQNAQLATNQLEGLKNQKGMIEAQLKDMPEGPPKDSLMAFLGKINEAIANLEEFLAQMDEGVAKSSEFEQAGSTDDGQIREKKVEEMKEKREEAESGLGGLFGGLGDIFGDLLGPLTDLMDLGGLMSGLTDMLDLGGLTDMLSLDGLTDMFGGIFEGFGLEGITDMLGGLMDNPMAMMLIGGSVLALVMMGPFAIPMALIGIGLGVMMMMSDKEGGDSDFLGGMFEDIPIVGDLLGGILDPIMGLLDPILSIFGMGGGGDDKSSSSSSSGPRERSRNAGNTAAASSVAGNTVEHAADEEAELKGQIAKLLNLLRGIASGNVDPSALTGDMLSTLGNITGSDGLEGLLGEGPAGLLGDAANAGMSGDLDGMIGKSMDALGETPEKLGDFAKGASNLVGGIPGLDIGGGDLDISSLFNAA